MASVSAAVARLQSVWRSPAAPPAAATASCAAHCLQPAAPRLQLAAARRVHTSGAAGAAAVVLAAAAGSSGGGGGGYQRALSNSERKAQRAAAQRLGRQICTLNLGQKGLSPSFLESFRLAVAANELVKVRPPRGALRCAGAPCRRWGRAAAAAPAGAHLRRQRVRGRRLLHRQGLAAGRAVGPAAARRAADAWTAALKPAPAAAPAATQPATGQGGVVRRGGRGDHRDAERGGRLRAGAQDRCAAPQ